MTPPSMMSKSSWGLLGGERIQGKQTWGLRACSEVTTDAQASGEGNLPGESAGRLHWRVPSGLALLY